MSIIEVKVPQLSESVSEATLLTWNKKVGEAVNEGESLIDIETDKVVLELPAIKSGVSGQDHQGRWRESRQRRSHRPYRHSGCRASCGCGTCSWGNRSSSQYSPGIFPCSSFSFGTQTGACARCGCCHLARQWPSRSGDQGRRAGCSADNLP